MKKNDLHKFLSLVTILIFAVSIIFAGSQQEREQKIGTPKAKKKLNYQLKGEVKSKATGQIVPNADITVTSDLQQKILSESKANAAGQYEVIIPKGVDVEVKAQAPALFYDAFKTIVMLDDTTDIVKHDFVLPSELSLRINFPSNKWDNPYPYVLDENGGQSYQTWQQAISSVSEDIKKYKDYISKVILIGHTDDVGKEDYNKELGQKRCDFVFEELEKRGVLSDMMEAHSSGKSELLTQNPGEDKESWRKRCRRVVMTKMMKR
jgi:flagellar motor protein MotB